MLLADKNCKTCKNLGKTNHIPLLKIFIPINVSFLITIKNKRSIHLHEVLNINYIIKIYHSTNKLLLFVLLGRLFINCIHCVMITYCLINNRSLYIVFFLVVYIQGILLQNFRNIITLKY